jgi:hypothetical protein
MSHTHTVHTTGGTHSPGLHTEERYATGESTQIALHSNAAHTTTRGHVGYSGGQQRRGTRTFSLCTASSNARGRCRCRPLSSCDDSTNTSPWSLNPRSSSVSVATPTQRGIHGASLPHPSAARHGITQHSTAQHSTAQHSTAQQSRAEQSRAEQSRAEQSRAEQSIALQSKPLTRSSLRLRRHCDLRRSNLAAG